MVEVRLLCFYSIATLGLLNFTNMWLPEVPLSQPKPDSEVLSQRRCNDYYSSSMVNNMVRHNNNALRVGVGSLVIDEKIPPLHARTVSTQCKNHSGSHTHLVKLLKKSHFGSSSPITVDRASVRHACMYVLAYVQHAATTSTYPGETFV